MTKIRDLIHSLHMSAAEREAVLKWRARNWQPAEAADEIEFWEIDFSTPDDPVLAAEQDAAHTALMRVAALE
jgi:hypothetical protein